MKEKTKQPAKRLPYYQLKMVEDKYFIWNNFTMSPEFPPVKNYYLKLAFKQVKHKQSKLKGIPFWSGLTREEIERISIWLRRYKNTLRIEDIMKRIDKDVFY